MRRKVIAYSQTLGFALECGHWSPVKPMPNTNLLKAIERMHRRRLWRDCPRCQRAANRAQSTAVQEKTG